MAQNNPVMQPAQQQTGIAKLKSMLNAPSVQAQFENALKENKNLFIASIIDLYNGDRSLQTCQPSAIISEALKAAVLDLPIARSLGFAYIVVYNNSVKDEHGQWHKVPTPTFVPGYKGYIQLAMRTGQYRTINADIVYEGELKGFDKLSGRPDLTGEKKSDKVVGYFCYFQLLNGYDKTLYMSVDDMAAYAKRYAPGIKRDTSVQQLVGKANQASVSGKVGWEGNFNDMALKTVIRRLISKYGYLSIKMQSAISSDNDADDRALMQRDELIATANQKVVEIPDSAEVDYEEVDTETGEVQTPAAKSDAPNKDAEPQAPASTDIEEEDAPGY